MYNLDFYIGFAYGCFLLCSTLVVIIGSALGWITYIYRKGQWIYDMKHRRYGIVQELSWLGENVWLDTTQPHSPPKAEWAVSLNEIRGLSTREKWERYLGEL